MGHFIPRLCPAQLWARASHFSSLPPWEGIQEWMPKYSPGTSRASTTTIKANSINYRPTVPLWRTEFVLGGWSTVTKAPTLHTFHLCTAQCQPVNIPGKFLARILLALKDPWRLLFQFLMFLWSLTLFSGLNKCTADTVVPQSWSTLITHKAFKATLLHLNFVFLENSPWLMSFVNQHENRKHVFKHVFPHIFPKARNLCGFQRTLLVQKHLAGCTILWWQGSQVFQILSIWRIPAIHWSQGHLLGTQIPVLGSKACCLSIPALLIRFPFTKDNCTTQIKASAALIPTPTSTGGKITTHLKTSIPTQATNPLAFS